MTTIESAWSRHPDYEINLVPARGVARAFHGDLLLAESANALRVQETFHVERLYFPVEDVRWEHFTPTEHTTRCPFKGDATYWSLTAVDPLEENVVWHYSDPYEEVAGIAGHVCFYQERTRITIDDDWPDGTTVTTGFPAWGDASDLLRLIDVAPAGDGRFVSEPYPTERNVVEGGHQLAQGIVAVSKLLPRQRVTSASMYFPKSAAFDVPLDIDVDVLREGRTFSTADVRVSQGGVLRSVGLFLLDAGAPDLIAHAAPMPDVPGPEDCTPVDMRVTGREIREVDRSYLADPDRIGPPEVNVWVRFRDPPPEQYLHQALVAQSSTHWTIAAALRPHPGYSQSQAHVTLSTAPMGVSIAFLDDIDASQWLLCYNQAIHSGRGLAQGEGHIFTRDGVLVATFTQQAMVRGFQDDPGPGGRDRSTAM
ncbi:MAG: DUF427 domain-containing protein [Acidimicrobiia bacterium]